VINNGSATNSTALMQTADADVIQMNKSPASVTLNNYGTMLSLNASVGGAQAVDFNAILAGTNTVNNYAGGLLKAFEADAVRPGVNGTVYNAGTILAITTTGSSSDGIDGQTNSGIQITNDTGGLIEGGRHAITGGNTDLTVNNGAYAMSVTNNLGGTIQGDNGSGLNIDGLNGNELVTIVNHGTITGHGVTGDGDGVDVDGLVNLSNTGTIRSLNSKNDTSEGVTVGGGTIVNSGTIQGSIDSPIGNTGTGRGITIAGVDKDANDKPIPIQAPYGPTAITNSGLIRGDSDSGIAFTSALASGFTTTITNQAGGVIEGAGATAATIQTGADQDTVINAGSIINAGGGSHVAVALGAGDDTLKITGGSAVVTGGMDGGSGGETAGDKLVFDLGAPDRQFTQNGAITNFEHVDVLSGEVQLNGSLALGSDTNALTVANGALLGLDGRSLTLDQGSMLVDGTLKFYLDGGTANGQLRFGAGNGGSLTLGADSLLDLEFGFTPTAGEQFLLVDFLADGPFLSGTFSGLAEGATFMDDGYKFQITYQGGNGHDIEITRSVPESAPTAALLFGAVGLMAFYHRRRA
jgi:hypothetical protein